MKEFAVIAVAFLLAAIRIAGHKSEAYQAVAHLFVGGLFVAGWGWAVAFGRSIWNRDDCPDVDATAVYFILAVALSVVELLCFLWFKFT